MALTTVDSGLISSGAITLTTQVTGTLPEANGGTGTTVGYCGFKNRIINGAMVIDQRNAGASMAVGANFFSAYCLDRWSPLATGSKYSVQQNAGSVTPPAGFSNYLGITSNSSYTLAVGDYFAIGQRIEGFNFADLDWGTANAKTITISAWVRSSLTGTFGGAIANNAQNRSYPFSYTISSANTWTQISVTIAGDTTGTWIGATNGIGLNVYFAFGVGSTYSGTSGSWAAANYVSATGATSVVGTSGATFYITGVQLEKGSTATSFDYRPYGTELSLCQRYYQTSYPPGVVANGVTTITDGVTWVAINNSDTSNGGSYPVSMRSTPTFTAYYPGGGAGVNSARDNDNGVAITGLNYYGGTASTIPRINKNAGLTARANTLSAQYTSSAEL